MGLRSIAAKGHVGIKSFDVELVDQEGNFISLYETYLYHWFAIKYHENITMSPNPKSHCHEDVVYQRNEGTCNDGMLPFYWDLELNHKELPQTFSSLML